MRRAWSSSKAKLITQFSSLECRAKVSCRSELKYFLRQRGKIILSSSWLLKLNIDKVNYRQFYHHHTVFIELKIDISIFHDKCNFKHAKAAPPVIMEIKLKAFMHFSSSDFGGEDQTGLRNGRHVSIRGDDPVSDVHPAGSWILVGFGVGRDWSCSVPWCEFLRTQILIPASLPKYLLFLKCRRIYEYDCAKEMTNAQFFLPFDSSTPRSTPSNASSSVRFVGAMKCSAKSAMSKLKWRKTASR